MKSRFISVEGGDGAGKSTLIGHIETFLKSNDIPYVVTREPGGTAIAEEIREILLKPDREMTALAELFLYVAARAEHVETFIKPRLREGVTVICDRFSHSTLAYQGAGRDLGMNLVREINNLACQGLKPDAVVWVKVTPETAKKRRGLRGLLSRLDAEAEDFHSKVFKAFDALSQDPVHNFITLDGERTPEEIARQLLDSEQWRTLFKKMGRFGA